MAYEIKSDKKGNTGKPYEFTWVEDVSWVRNMTAAVKMYLEDHGDKASKDRRELAKEVQKILIGDEYKNDEDKIKAVLKKFEDTKISAKGGMGFGSESILYKIKQMALATGKDWQIKELERVIHQQKNDISNQQKIIQKQTEDIADKNAIIKSNDDVIAKRNEEIAKLGIENASLSKSAENTKIQLNEQGQAIEKVSNENAALNQKLEAADKSIIELTHERNQLHDKNINLGAKLEGKNVLISASEERLTTENAKLQNEAEKMQNKLNETVDQNAKLTKENAELKQVNAVFQKTIEDSKDTKEENTALRKVNAEVKKENTELNQVNSGLRKQIEDLIKSLMTAQKKVEILLNKQPADKKPVQAPNITPRMK